VDLSLTTVYAFSHLEVIVISDDGWSWIFAWRQLGVQNIYALPLTDVAVEQLKTVKVLLKEIKVVDSMNNALRIDTGHIHEWNNVWNSFICNVEHGYDTRLVLSDTRKHSKAIVKAYEESTGYRCFVQELRHRRLGVLTGARMNLIWRSPVGYKQLRPEMRRLEHRSMTLFMEPVARLAARASL
jgi:hypothetical protein